MPAAATPGHQDWGTRTGFYMAFSSAVAVGSDGAAYVVGRADEDYGTGQDYLTWRIRLFRTNELDQVVHRFREGPGISHRRGE